MTLHFSDGISVDTKGEYRKLRLHDGWYVIGHGMMMPVRDEQEADQMIEELRE